MYIQSIQFFKECAIFCICNVHNIPKSLRTLVYSMYTNFQFYTFCIYFLYTLNIYNFLNNVHNLIHSMYTILSKYTLSDNTYIHTYTHIHIYIYMYIKEVINLLLSIFFCELNIIISLDSIPIKQNASYLVFNYFDHVVFYNWFNHNIGPINILLANL